MPYFVMPYFVMPYFVMTGLVPVIHVVSLLALGRNSALPIRFANRRRDPL